MGLSAQAQPTDLQRFEYRQTRMGMAVRVVLYAPSDSAAREAGTAAYRRMAALENIFSSYKSSSELNQLREQAVERPVRVSAPLFTVLQDAQRLGRQSNGAFDVTAGPLFDLWAQARKTGTLPDSSALRQARRRVGWSKIQLNEDRRTVRLRVDSVQLNLGGIAKGFILDQALDTLRALGISRALIEAGGDLVMSGPPPSEDGWNVELPGAGPDGQSRTRRLTHTAVSTSGDTYQSVVINGTRYSHVVDPRTGLGLTHHLLVTVIANNGMRADGLATTVSVLGPDHGRTFLEEHYPSVTAYIRPHPRSHSSK
jgi:thiamine biosynthesis lipoprotein